MFDQWHNQSGVHPCITNIPPQPGSTLVLHSSSPRLVMRTLLFILLFCGPLVHAGIFDGVFSTLASLSPFQETQHRNFSPKGAKPWAPRRPHQSLRPFPNLPIRTKEAEEEPESTAEEINKIVDDEVVDDFDYLFDTEG